ncbi:unnamed protein product [Symbiodinium sp. KB8]|nr:unnamed protein product [Symbiodinium sp. KB8]
MMLSATSGMVTERGGVGFTLHRSETVAQSAGQLDRKNSAASSRARGRSSGFACKHNVGYKPLGAPVTSERVVEMQNSSFANMEKIQQSVGQDTSSHQEKKDKERKGRKEQKVEARSLSDSRDFKDEEAAAEGLEADSTGMQSLSRLPHALYGKDLPRCGQAQERQEKDGFKELKVHIKSSSRRVELVRIDADAAYAARSDNAKLALATSRHWAKASPDTGSGGVFLTSLEAPQSARERRQLPKASPKRATWLPSLSEYLANGAGLPASERAELADVGTTHKIAAELLPLPKGTRPNYGSLFLLDEGKAGSKDFKDRLKEHRKLWEKDLAGAWKEKAFYQRCQPFVAPKDAEEMRQRCHGNDYMQAAIERHVKDLERSLKDSGVEARGANDEPKGLPATAATIKVDVDANGMPGPSAPTSPAQEATLQEKRRADADDDQRISEPVKLVAARSRNHAIHQKALAQLREPDRQKNSLILRQQLKEYQEKRDEARKNLQETLESQAESRMVSLEAPTRKSLASDVETSDGQQHHWYRSLLEQIRTELATADVPKAMYMLLDSVKTVLDEGDEFEADDFWQCISELRADDVTFAMASLLGSVIHGVGGLTGPSVVRALQQQCGKLNPGVADVLNAQ